jgi:hypothetical protein
MKVDKFFQKMSTLLKRRRAEFHPGCFGKMAAINPQKLFYGSPGKQDARRGAAAAACAQNPSHLQVKVDLSLLNIFQVFMAPAAGR